MADRHKNRTLESEAVRKSREADKTFSIDDRLHKARERIDWKRRKSAEKSLAAWLTTYGVGVFVDDPPPKPHGVKILAEMEEAVTAARPYQILVARGGGKTSYTEAFAAYAVATGKRRFCVITSVNAKQAQQILREITALFTSEPFATDYPDIALPIVLLDGHGRRSQRYGGKDTKVRIVTDETQLPTIVDDGVPSAASGACFRAKALKSVRGTKNGTQRPDLIILDDLQTREIAENDERVQDVLNLIRGEVMGLAGKGKASIVSTATTIARDDVTEQLAADPSWKTTRNPAILRWPREWHKDGHGLWGEYFRLFDDENAHDQKHTRRGGSLAFYRAHRAEMDLDADILNWDNYDRKGGQASGLQKLMDKYHEMGRAAFMAEYQMEPLKTSFTYDLTPRIILERVRRGTPMGYEPEGTVFTAAATDINPSYALSTAVARFDISRSCFVCGYFVQRVSIDSAVNDTAYNRRIFETVAQHGRALKDLGISLDAWGVDAGGKQFDAVTRFGLEAANVCGLQAIPMLGRAGRSWNPKVRSRIGDAINDTVLCRDPAKGIWLAWDADTYKEQMQRSWGTETGAPGGCSIFDGGINHTPFATQVSNETLVAKQKLLDGRIDWRWKTKEPHDFGDCMAMLFALAGFKSISGMSAGMTDARPARLEAVSPSAVRNSPSDGIEIGCDF